MRLAELMAELDQLPAPQPDAGCDTYRLEQVITDLRGHNPRDLDYKRLFECWRKLALVLNQCQQEAAE